MPLNDGYILGLGSPLMDIISRIDCTLLRKYHLKSNSAMLSNGNHTEIYEELNGDDIEYVPGGSPQNTLRTLSWILKQPNVATFMGCVGQDKNASIMRQKAEDIGLKVLYQVDEKNETGTCLVLVAGKERTLITNQGAANNFSLSYLEKNWSYVEKAKYFYISSFFFIVSSESIIHLANYSKSNNRIFILNLSAPFLCQCFKGEIIAILPYVDVLFGNDDEFRSFAEETDYESYNLETVSKMISNSPKLNDRKRTVVITQGAGNVICTTGDDVVLTSVPSVQPEKIIDTNGAGDAFVGGFLSQFINEKPLEKCIDCGIWAAVLMIQQSGCSFSNLKCTYN